jgi:1-pyrroline-4-hydroxy-2-carboxylate deaminase
MIPNWTGVMPAMTTAFHTDGTLDAPQIARHAAWLAEHGSTALVVSGSLGEGATLTMEEKWTVAEVCREAVGGRIPIVLGIASLSTAEAIATAKGAEARGCGGLMVLPPYVYKSDDREMEAHVRAVFDAVALPCMLYNNPVAYGVDYRPERIAYLAEKHANLTGVKESSTDVRRVAEIREICGERLNIAVGVDDVIVEAISVGAVGWVAGLVNSFPAESVALFNRAMAGDYAGAWPLYRWFLPLLRLDTVPKFVQLIKLTQEAVGMVGAGGVTCRPPRLPLEGAELAATQAIIRKALQERPTL